MTNILSSRTSPSGPDAPVGQRIRDKEKYSMRSVPNREARILNSLLIRSERGGSAGQLCVADARSCWWPATDIWEAVDEYRRDAIRKLEQLREAHTLQQIVPDQIPSGRPNRKPSSLSRPHLGRAMCRLGMQWKLAARAVSRTLKFIAPDGLPCSVTPRGTCPPFGSINLTPSC
jgi:hypothetical protein